MWNRIIGVVGPTGSGKSHKAAEIMAGCERAAVYQIVREDANFLDAATDIFDGDIKAFCLALGEDEFRYIYRVAHGAKRVEGNKIVLPDFELFIACCFERRNMMMLIDEAHFLCSTRFIPAQFWESIVTGRHAYLDIVYVTQRFAMVHHDLTAQSHELYLWNVTEPGDINGITERCGEEVAQAVASLRKTEDRRRDGGPLVPGEYIHWTAGGGYKIYDPYQFREVNPKEATYGESQSSESSTGPEVFDMRDRSDSGQLRDTHTDSAPASSTGDGNSA